MIEVYSNLFDDSQVDYETNPACLIIGMWFMLIKNHIIEMC